MRHAFVAGGAVAVMCAVVGWFVVLRRETYAAHSLAMVAFPGASAAAYLGISPLVGYFTGGLTGALAMIWLRGGPDRDPGSRHSAAVGSVQAVALGLGLLFASLYRGFLTNATSFLFGSFLGVTAAQATILVAVALAAVLAVAAVARPLLFATVDPPVAEGVGVPVGLLSGAFVVLLALAVAAASQFTGVLLVFALLVAPAATAQVLSARPSVSLALTIAISCGSAWCGLAAAFFTDRPVGFWITTIAFVAYVAARAGRAAVERAGRRS
jgi:zinc/manganese transport system permease protein